MWSDRIRSWSQKLKCMGLAISEFVKDIAWYISARNTLTSYLCDLVEINSLVIALPELWDVVYDLITSIMENSRTSKV